MHFLLFSRRNFQNFLKCFTNNCVFLPNVRIINAGFLTFFDIYIYGNSDKDNQLIWNCLQLIFSHSCLFFNDYEFLCIRIMRNNFANLLKIIHCTVKQRRRQDFGSGGGHFRGWAWQGGRGAEPPGRRKIFEILQKNFLRKLQ